MPHNLLAFVTGQCSLFGLVPGGGSVAWVETVVVVSLTRSRSSSSLAVSSNAAAYIAGGRLTR